MKRIKVNGRQTAFVAGVGDPGLSAAGESSGSSLLPFRSDRKFPAGLKKFPARLHREFSFNPLESYAFFVLIFQKEDEKRKTPR